MKRKRSKRDSASRAEPEVRIHLPPDVSQAYFRIAPLAHPDPVERQPELLAHHLTAAKRAVTQCLKASRHAGARSAYKLNARPTRGDFLDPTGNGTPQQLTAEARRRVPSPGYSVHLLSCGRY